MAANPSFHIKPLGVAQALDRFVALAEDLYPKQPFSLNVQSNISGVGAEFSQQAAAGLSSAKEVTAFRARIAEMPFLMAATVVLTHPQATQGPIVRYTVGADRLTGDIAINARPEEVDRVVKAVHHHLNVNNYRDVVAAQLAESERTALQLRERSVADLHAHLEKLAAFMSDLAQRETEARRTLQAELDQDHRERVAKADQQHLDRQLAADAREQEARGKLDQDARTLDERVKAFETRESKHVRRDLLERMEALLRKTADPKLTETTGKKRRVVHGFSLLLMTISGVVLALFAEAAAKEPSNWHLFLPLAASSATLVATFVYYLKWNDRWFRDHADAELSMRAFQRDVLRASWVAELVSEWAKENQGRELPDELLNAFTRNLFRAPGPTRENEHPYEHLTSMMRRANEFTIGKNVLSVKAAPWLAASDRDHQAQGSTRSAGEPS